MREEDEEKKKWGDIILYLGTGYPLFHLYRRRQEIQSENHSVTHVPGILSCLKVVTATAVHSGDVKSQHNILNQDLFL